MWSQFRRRLGPSSSSDATLYTWEECRGEDVEWWRMCTLCMCVCVWGGGLKGGKEGTILDFFYV